MPIEDGNSSEPDSDSPPSNPKQPRILESSELLDGEKSVMIHHAGTFYRLTSTRNGKLILQK